MMRTDTVIKMTVQQMVCTSCGAEANASCNCGKPYVPKKQRAKEAIEANPQRSNRAIADEIGADEKVVRRAREAADLSAPEREGRDGKVYRLPTREVEPEQKEIKESFFTLVDMALRVSALDLGSVSATPKMREAVKEVIEAWTEAQRRMSR